MHVTIWEVDDDKDQIEGLDEHGQPDPSYAAALGLLNAPLPRRSLAFGIDALVYAVLQVPYWLGAFPLLLKYLSGRISAYGLLNHPSFTLALVMTGASVLLTTAYLVVQIVLHGRKGVTLGKAVTGIRSVNVKTLERPGVFRVLLRGLVVWASLLVLVGPLLFLASPLFDPNRRRGWHDHVGQTWLVDIRNGLNPYDSKRMRVARKAVRTEPIARPQRLPSLATSADRSEQEYRPGARVSAGVLGVARPHGGGPRPVVGLPSGEQSLATGSGSGPPQPGRPVVGGYRRGTTADMRATQALQPVGYAEAQQQPGDAHAPSHAAAPEAPSPQPPPQQQHRPIPEPAAVACALALDTGQRVIVDEVVVVGRNPVPPATDPGARPHPLVDDSLSISKTHAVLRPVAGGVEVVDQGSTNGTFVLRQNREHPVQPGRSELARPGDTIRFGDRHAMVVPS